MFTNRIIFSNFYKLISKPFFVFKTKMIYLGLGALVVVRLIEEVVLLNC